MDEVLEAALARARSVRFLCSGNMVRSAFAELYARRIGCRLAVDSAATTYRNSGLYPETRAALLARGVSAAECDAFRSRHLADLPPEEPVARVVFGMTPAHLEEYRGRFGDRDPLFLTSELVGASESIADPVLEGASFELAFRAVARAVEALVEQVGGH